jgi:hypothetical protein
VNTLICGLLAGRGISPLLATACALPHWPDTLGAVKAVPLCWTPLCGCSRTGRARTNRMKAVSTGHSIP